MKKITEDLKITGIEISMLKQIALVKLLYLDEYAAEAQYDYRSTGNTWLETEDLPKGIHEAITTEVEENEDKVIEWVNEQIDKAE